MPQSCGMFIGNTKGKHTIAMKYFFALVCAIATVFNVYGQDSLKPYKVNYPIIGSIIGVGAGTSIYTTYRILNKPGLSTEQVLALDRSEVNVFDRNATKQYSHGALTANRVLSFSSMALPLFLAIDKNIRKDAGTVGLMYLEALSMSHLVFGLQAAFIDRQRPYVYNPDAPMDVRTAGRGQTSYYAYLPMVTAVSSVFAAKVWSDYHPNHRLKPLVWTAAGTAILGSNLLSYYSGDAHPTDLLVGTALGAATGFLVPYFKLKLAEKKAREGMNSQRRW